jgi:hypothetical protein
VTSARRTRAFHHYTVSGELSVEQEEVLEETIEEVVCRWCGPSGSVTVEVAAVEGAAAEVVTGGGAGDEVPSGPGPHEEEHRSAGR